MTSVIPFSKCLSHPERLLANHHANVAELMFETAKQFGGSTPDFFADLAKLVGFTHDLGKGTTYFQEGRLNGKRIPRRELGNHSSLGALLAYSSVRAFVDQECDSGRAGGSVSL